MASMQPNASSTSGFPAPQTGASLLLSFQPQSTTNATIPFRRTALIIGGSRLAAVRSLACLEAGFDVVLASASDASLDAEIRWRLTRGEVGSSALPADTGGCSWRRWLEALPFFDDIGFVCLADTSLLTGASSDHTTHKSVLALRQACFAHRIPLNVADHPHLSDFSFPITYRWPSSSSSDDSQTPLQLAISTSASSCRLAVRLRREIVAKVSKRAGEACEAIGELRKRAKQLAHAELGIKDPEALTASGGAGRLPVRRCARAREKSLDRITDDGAETEADLISGGAGSHALNRPVEQLSDLFRKTSVLPPTPPATPPPDAPTLSDQAAASLAERCSPSQLAKIALATRMRWIAQISEYWSLDRIAALGKDEGEMERVLQVFPGSFSAALSASLSNASSGSTPQFQSKTDGTSSSRAGTESNLHPLDSNVDSTISARHGFTLSPAPNPSSSRGRILLVGSGPGHPGLLTMAANAALTKFATLVLSDKLVPAEVLALVPKTTRLYIAKKYPGNAEGAQSELMEMALEGARKGEVVVRLKQGDPYLYGRGGEEVLFFRRHGFECTVVPGVSSALAAPLMAGIPVTQRGAAESLVVCTGVGRKGKGVALPGYERARTLVVLMGVARLQGVVGTLVAPGGEPGGGGREGPAYPAYTPIAVIERASSPDQRLVATTLDRIVEALESAGEQRPPGMMVVGWSVLALEREGDVTVLDGVEGMSAEQREAADRARVEKWLDGKPWIVREGLSEEWDRLMEEVRASEGAAA